MQQDIIMTASEQNMDSVIVNQCENISFVHLGNLLGKMIIASINICNSFPPQNTDVYNAELKVLQNW